MRYLFASFIATILLVALTPATYSTEDGNEDTSFDNFGPTEWRVYNGGFTPSSGGATVQQVLKVVKQAHQITGTKLDEEALSNFVTEDESDSDDFYILHPTFEAEVVALRTVSELAAEIRSKAATATTDQDWHDVLSTYHTFVAQTLLLFGVELPFDVPLINLPGFGSNPPVTQSMQIMMGLEGSSMTRMAFVVAIQDGDRLVISAPMARDLGVNTMTRVVKGLARSLLLRRKYGDQAKFAIRAAEMFEKELKSDISFVVSKAENFIEWPKDHLDDWRKGQNLLSDNLRVLSMYLSSLPQGDPIASHFGVDTAEEIAVANDYDMKCRPEMATLSLPGSAQVQNLEWEFIPGGALDPYGISQVDSLRRIISKTLESPLLPLECYRDETKQQLMAARQALTRAQPIIAGATQHSQWMQGFDLLEQVYVHTVLALSVRVPLSETKGGLMGHAMPIRSSGYSIQTLAGFAPQTNAPRSMVTLVGVSGYGGWVVFDEKRFKKSQDARLRGLGDLLDWLWQLNQARGYYHNKPNFLADIPYYRDHMQMNEVIPQAMALFDEFLASPSVLDDYLSFVYEAVPVRLTELDRYLSRHSTATSIDAALRPDWRVVNNFVAPLLPPCPPVLMSDPPRQPSRCSPSGHRMVEVPFYRIKD